MRPNPIGWCDLTINPITGCSNCDIFGLCQGRYKCYAEGFARRLSGIEARHPGRTGYPPIPHHFTPCWHQKAFERILKLRGSGKRVFLDSMSDWFSVGIPTDWIQEVLLAVEKKPKHHFLVLTKRPDRIEKAIRITGIPENLWIGTSVTSQEDLWRISALKGAIPPTARRFVSFEPLLGPIEFGPDGIGGIDWCIVGALTGHQPSSSPLCTGDMPLFAWIDRLLVQILNSDIPLFMKDNLRESIGIHTLLQQFPEGMD